MCAARRRPQPLIGVAILATLLTASAIAEDRPRGSEHATANAVQLADEGTVSYRLEIAGDVHIRFVASCRILKSSDRLSVHDKWVSFADQAPAQYDVSGPAVVCTVRKTKGEGTMTVMLRRGDGVPIGYSTLLTRGHQLELRTVGPWGGGGVRVF